MDLLDFFRGNRPWGQFHRFVSELPPESKFKSAQAADPELAKVLADRPEGKSGHPTLEGYDLQTKVLIGIFNMLKISDWHLLRVNGNKVPQPDLWMIPKTALERELSYRKKLAVDSVLAELGVN